MNRNTVFGVMLTLLLIGMLTLTFEIQLVKAEPKTWYVDDDGPAHFHTIQEAINAASPGDTICVYNGTYYERLTVNKNNLTLRGEDRDNTIIDGSRTGDVVYVTSNNVTISGFSIQNGGYGNNGVTLSYSRHVTINNNVIVQGQQIGISLKHSNDNTITANTVAHNAYGVLMDDSLHNFVRNNTIDSSGALGLTLEYSHENIIGGNTIVSSGMDGIWLYYSGFNTVFENTVSNNLYGIDLYGGSHNMIYHNNFVNNTNGVPTPGLSSNFWDDGYPSGGNYWSDHSGTDWYGGPYQNETGSDGIVDTPYIIDESNQDNYPFMNPWGPVHNINTTLNYWMIQDAIDAPETLDGHTIFVEAGTYHEHILVNKTLSLIGEDRDTTIIDGSGKENVALITSNGTVIKGFTIQNSGEHVDETGSYVPWSGILVACFMQGPVPMSNIQLKDLRVCKNEIGMYLVRLQNSSIVANHIVNNTRGMSPYGVILFACGKTQFENNTVEENQAGISVFASRWNTLEDNTVSRNEIGIILDGYEETRDPRLSGQNIIINNLISKNVEGARLEYSCDNIIYHNNFVDNAEQIHTWGLTSIWDDGYPSGGNYWSDYEERYPNATEIGGSGIWDAPYVIDETNQDNYPLMNPWTPRPPIPTTIDELKTETEELGLQGEIDNQGIVTSLLGKLDVAQKLIDDGKTDQAKTILESFIRQVQNLTEIHITPEAADVLVESAEYIISHL